MHKTLIRALTGILTLTFTLISLQAFALQAGYTPSGSLPPVVPGACVLIDAKAVCQTNREIQGNCQLASVFCNNDYEAWGSPSHHLEKDDLKKCAYYAKRCYEETTNLDDQLNFCE